jgi:hypothetical protein
MLNVRHNKHIPLNIHNVTPYGTTVHTLYTHLLTGKPTVSADPNHNKVEINHFSLDVQECGRLQPDLSLYRKYMKGHTADFSVIKF